MQSTRRTFVKNGALIATGAAFAKLTPRQLAASPLEDTYGAIDAGWKAIIQHGLDVAKSSGASYADIRITFTRKRTISVNGVGDTEAIHCGIRCLINGYWGFSSSPIAGTNEMTRLAHEATAQAKANTIGKARVVDLAKASVVSSGNWIMPIQIDPFDVHPLDGCDLIRGVEEYAKNAQANAKLIIQTVRQDKAFGSTDGSYFTQRVFRTQGGGQVSYPQGGTRSFDPYSWSGVGWELFEPTSLRAYIGAMIEACKEDATFGRKMIEVGRYPMVLDSGSVARVLAATIGLATELDRALGYEANATGTSYLNDPDEMVGVQKVGTSLLSVTGNRNEPGGVATVQWDDDGVVPEPFEIVRDGVLQHFQTTRESAHWIGTTPGVQGGTVKSTGCANAATGVDAPITRSANLAMASAENSTTLPDLYRDVKKGVLFGRMGCDMDFQQLNGFGVGLRCYEITNGKRTAILVNAGVLFRAPELWKSLLALGGKQTVARYGLTSEKGQPSQDAYHSVSAVPALFENATIIDYTRKA